MAWTVLGVALLLAACGPTTVRSDAVADGAPDSASADVALDGADVASDVTATDATTDVTAGDADAQDASDAPDTPVPVYKFTCTASWNCDDGNVCTNDVCEVSGDCTHEPANGFLCNDGDPCSSTDFCMQGACTGKAGNCDVDCVFNSDCDDGDACTTDLCGNLSKCFHSDKSCGDKSPCTNDACDPVTGACVHEPSFGTCKATFGADACHIGVCDPDKGYCSPQVKPDGAPCDDGNACTADEHCLLGVCTGWLPCDDGDGCTIDCDPKGSGGCIKVPAPLGTPCEDGNPCTTLDKCEETGCSGGATVACVEFDKQCTVDLAVCDPAFGCHKAVPDGSPCGNDHTCKGGVCKICPDGAYYTTAAVLPSGITASCVSATGEDAAVDAEVYGSGSNCGYKCPTQGCATDDAVCGLPCATCSPGKACVSGQCAACVPQCAPGWCGTNGCGGWCPMCPAGSNCVAGSCQPGCSNCPSGNCSSFDFEGPSPGWDFSGRARITSAFGIEGPPDGSAMLSLTGDPIGRARTTICLSKPATKLRFVWQMFSFEGCGTQFEDRFTIRSTYGGVTTNLVQFNVNDVCPAKACVGCGGPFAVKAFTKWMQVGMDWIERSGWHVATVDIPPVESGAVLTLEVEDMPLESIGIQLTTVLIDDLELLP